MVAALWMLPGAVPEVVGPAVRPPPGECPARAGAEGLRGWARPRHLLASHLQGPLGLRQWESGSALLRFTSQEGQLSGCAGGSGGPGTGASGSLRRPSRFLSADPGPPERGHPAARRPVRSDFQTVRPRRHVVSGAQLRSPRSARHVAGGASLRPAAVWCRPRAAGPVACPGHPDASRPRLRGF